MFKKFLIKTEMGGAVDELCNLLDNLLISLKCEN